LQPRKALFVDTEGKSRVSFLACQGNQKELGSQQSVIRFKRIDPFFWYFQGKWEKTGNQQHIPHNPQPAI
jgi:hypothetical protein